jgi:hypothetical protein
VSVERGYGNICDNDAGINDGKLQANFVLRSRLGCDVISLPTISVHAIKR